VIAARLQAVERGAHLVVIGHEEESDKLVLHVGPRG